MANNRHPLTGDELELPDRPPQRRFAIYDSDQPCLDHWVAFTGRIPCTGDLRCSLCGTEWDADSGKLVRTYKMVETPPRMKGTFISELVGDTPQGEFLHLPAGTEPQTAFDVVTALQRAYRQGRRHARRYE